MTTMYKALALRSDDFAAWWTEFEATRPVPRWMRNVVEVPYGEFAADLMRGDRQSARRLVESLYAGDVYVLKGAFSPEYCLKTVAAVYGFGTDRPAGFQKMLDGCPDFHRIIDHGVTTSYSVTAVRHGYYFFRWNDDPLGLFGPITERWRVFKTLSGLAPDAYEANVPSTGVVDRLIFYRYPKGGGRLKTHFDPTNNHKIIMGGLLSARGVDFHSGGIYFLAPGDEVVEIENHLQLGDFFLAYPTVHHGVAPVDVTEPLIWDTVKGRWFMGLSSVDSDHVGERVTAQRVE